MSPELPTSAEDAFQDTLKPGAFAIGVTPAMIACEPFIGGIPAIAKVASAERNVPHFGTSLATDDHSASLARSADFSCSTLTDWAHDEATTATTTSEMNLRIDVSLR